MYGPHVKGKRPAIAFVTIGELRFWSYKRKWGKRRLDDLTARLRSVIIVPYDDLVCDVYAQLKAEMSASGKSIADNDLWIASCAVRHSLPLITHKRAHFENVPRLKIISECPVVTALQSQGSLLDNLDPAMPASGPEPPA